MDCRQNSCRLIKTNIKNMIDIEIVGTKEAEEKSLAIIQENDLSSEEATSLKNALDPFFQQADEWVTKARTLKVTDDTQIEQMVEARKVRLELRDIRVNLDKKRKELKEESLRKGRAIDGMANVLKFLIEPIEEYLEKQEKFVEIREEERKARILGERTEKLQSIGVDPAFYDLKEMTEETFNQLVTTAEENAKLKKEAEERAEADRIEKEKKEAEEREAQKIENDRLKAENDAKEAELKKEREAKEKLEKEKRDREEKERKDREREEREKKAEAKRLAKMGDTEKVKAIIDTLKAVKLPEVKSEEANALVGELAVTIQQMIIKVEQF